MNKPSLPLAIYLWCAGALFSLAQGPVVVEPTAGLVDGQLVITDTAGVPNEFQLVLVNDGTDVYVSDARNHVIAGPGTTRDGAGVRVSLSGIRKITVQGQAGNDQLTIDFNGGLFPCAIEFNGGGQDGAPGDILALEGGRFDTVVYNHLGDLGNDGFDGTIEQTGTGRITFTGLEPLTNSGTAADIIFNLPAVVDNATLSNSANFGEMEITGATFENTIFLNPIDSLTINGDLVDTVDVAGVDAAFSAELEVNAGIVNVAGPVASSNHDVRLNADTIDIAAALDAGTARVELAPATAGRVINMGGVAGGLDLGDGEIDNITAGVLQIGSAAAGRIRFHGTTNSGLITPANVDTVRLISGSFIDDDTNDGNGGGIRVANLLLEAGGFNGDFAIDFNNGNNNVESRINVLAARSSDGRIRFFDNTAIADLGLTVGTVDGVAGVINTTPGSAPNNRERMDVEAIAGNLVVATDCMTGRNLQFRVRQENRDLIINPGVSITATGGGTKVYRADNIQIDATANLLHAGQPVQLRPDDSSDAIRLGDAGITNDDTLQISQAEIDRITANRIEIGFHNNTTGDGAGPLTVVAPIVLPGTVNDLRLRANSTISQTAGSTLIVGRDLGVNARAEVSLDEANLVTRRIACDVRVLNAATSGNITVRNNNPGAWSIDSGAGVGNFMRTNNGDILVNSVGTVNVDESTGDTEVEFEALTMGLGNGDITVNVGQGTTDGRDFQLNDATSGNVDKTNMEAAGNITINILGTGDVRLFALDSSRITAGGDITFDLNGSNNNTRIVPHGGAQITCGGIMNWIIRSNNGQFITNNDDSLPVIISCLNGPFTMELDRYIPNATTQIDCSGQTLTIKPFAAGDGINLGQGGDATDGTLRMSVNDLAGITADELVFGDADTGDITVVGSVTTAGKLRLNTQGATALQANVTAGSLETDAGGTSVISDGVAVIATGPVLFSDSVAFGAGTTAAGAAATAAPFQAADAVGIDLNGTTAGTLHDQLVVTGTVNLTGGTLIPALGFSPAINDSFTIIENDGGDPVVGTFTGLAEGGSLLLGTSLLGISYAGGDGNDVVLTFLGDLPTAGNNPFTRQQNDQPQVYAFADLLANDAPGGGGTIDVTGVQAVSNNGGTVQLFPGFVVYTPPAGDFTPDVFTYTITETPSGGTAMAQVMVTTPGSPATQTVDGVDAAGGDVTVRFTGVPLVTYTIEEAPAAIGPYTAVGTATADGRGKYEITVTPGSNPAFFRSRFP